MSKLSHYVLAAVQAGLFLTFMSTSGKAQEGPSVEVSGGEGANAQAAVADGGGQGGPGVPLWRLPVLVTVSLNTGYDENASTMASGEGSVFTSAAVNIDYSFGTSRTKADFSSSTGLTYYPELNNNRYDPNVNLSLAVTHQVNLRLTLNAVIGFRYSAEPDFSNDLSIDRRAGDYFSTDNSLVATYTWLPRFSTITNYSFATVQYENGSVSAFQDRFDNTIGQSLRFLYLPATALIAEYRISFVSYEGVDRDSHTQAILVGLDHSFSSRLQGTFRGGAEFRSTDDPLFQASDGVSPHFEANLIYTAGGKTTLSLNASYGTQESYIANSAASETFRAGLTASYEITPRLHAIASGSYQHNENEGVEFFPGFFLSYTEDAIDFSLGLTYRLNRYLTANASYNRTDVESDFGFRSYSRNRYSGGLAITF